MIAVRSGRQDAINRDAACSPTRSYTYRWGRGSTATSSSRRRPCLPVVDGASLPELEEMAMCTVIAARPDQCRGRRRCAVLVDPRRRRTRRTGSCQDRLCACASRAPSAGTQFSGGVFPRAMNLYRDRWPAAKSTDRRPRSGICAVGAPPASCRRAQRVTASEVTASLKTVTTRSSLLYIIPTSTDHHTLSDREPATGWDGRREG